MHLPRFTDRVPCIWWIHLCQVRRADVHSVHWSVNQMCTRRGVGLLVDVANHEEHRPKDRHHVGDQLPWEHLTENLHVVE